MSDKPLPDGTATLYYLDDDFENWGSSNLIIYSSGDVLSAGSVLELEIDVPAKPTAITGQGYLTLVIYEMSIDAHTGEKLCDLNFVSIAPVGNEQGIIGEFHTIQRKGKKNSAIKDIVEVQTGDNLADVYSGTLYKSDATTATETWFRKGISEEKPLLRIMCEDAMRMFQNPTRIFEGDIYGFIDSLSVININGVSGKFIVLDYSYSTYENITKLKLQQILGDELEDQDYEDFYTKTYDRGETVKPTIIG
jgi:hypothetical protein